jgi:Glycosyl transferase family 2
VLIYGVMMVRNEADIIALTIRHHLAHGVDRMLVVDNGSSDGTDCVLEELNRDSRVQWTRSNGKFRQADITTELAREAFLRGAEWVLPIDADEFWFAPGNDFRAVLHESTAGSLEVEIVNFIQRREQHEANAGALLSMTRRAIPPTGTPEQAVELVQSHDIGFVEFPYPPKCISRASISLQIGQGNHSVAGVVGPQEETDRIICLHAPLRARSVLESKVDHGRRADEVAQDLVQAWHVRRWRRLAEEGQLDREWAANSYQDDQLDVYGRRHPVIFDPRLKVVLEPWIEDGVAGGQTTSRSFPSLPLQLRPEASIDQSELALRVQQQETGIAFLRSEIGRREQVATDLQGHVHGLIGALGQRDAEIAERERSLQELRDTTVQQEEAIAGLQAEVAYATAELGAYRQSKLVWIVRLYWSVRQRLF